MAGYVMDRVGPRRVLLFLSACVCAGQRMGEIVITRATSVLTVVTVIHCIVAFIAGMTNRSPALMLAGRAVFGIGGESISVAQACITTSWFRNKELAFALGLNLAVPRVGSVLNAMLSPAVWILSASMLSQLQGYRLIHTLIHRSLSIGMSRTRYLKMAF